MSEQPAAARAAAEPFLTYLFTDIEGSTRLWEEHAETMSPALAAHDRLLRGVVEAAGGTVVKLTGDGMLATFANPGAAVDAALAGQRALSASAGRTGASLRVRMALHAGAAEARDGDVFGQSINRVARILATGHGGQTLLSASAALLVRDRLAAGASLVDLGTHRLRDLDRPEQLYQLVVPDLPHDFPPLRSLSTRRTNIPAQLTSFVGREPELAEVEALVGRHRLVTLIGTGGTGKTRLMLEAAGRLARRFSEGIWLAELAPLADSSAIASEIARALGAPDVPGVTATAVVTQYLAGKDLLLLIDNAEHLVDGVADLAIRLLAAAPQLRILATSREALAVPGEAVIQLQSLAVPRLGSEPGAHTITQDELAHAAATDAVRLFVERASAVDPTFALTTANVEAVAEICRRLDGIPLAIELAAARVSAMSVEDIAVRLGDRFRLLAGGRRTAVPRQQTLHALIDWSWDLLTEDDRRLLRRLAIFAGGWTVAAAAGIVGDPDGRIDELELIDGLARLVDRSLVIVDRGPTTRYRMLETIRQYAREKLIAAGEVAVLGDRHFAVFATMVVEAEPGLRGPLMVEWLDRLDADADNIASAFEWGLEAAPWEAIRMAASGLVYWDLRIGAFANDAGVLKAVSIVRSRAADGSLATPEDQALAARFLGVAAQHWASLGRGPEALPWAREAVALGRSSGDAQATLAAMVGLVVSMLSTGGGPAVEKLTEEVVELAEQTGTWWLVAVAAGFAGAGMWSFDPTGAERFLAKGEEGARRSGSPTAIAALALAKGRMFGLARRTDEAIAQFTISMDRNAQVGDTRSVLSARSDMAHALRRGGRLDEAEALYRQTISGWVHFGNRGAVAHQLENVAYLAIERGEAERAARLLGAAEAIRAAAGAQMAAEEAPELAAYLERLRRSAEPSLIDAEWAAGRSLSMAEAVALASSG